MLRRLRAQLAGLPSAGRGDVPGERLAALTEKLARLRSVERGLPRRALRFVLDGEGGEVLLDLASHEGGGAALELDCVPVGFRTAMGRVLLQGVRGLDRRHRRERALYAGLTAADGPYLLRLGQVFEAASRRERRLLAASQAGAPAWLEILLLESRSTQLRDHDPPPLFSAEALEAALVEEGGEPEVLVQLALGSDPSDWTLAAVRTYLASLADFAAAAQRHPRAVLAALSGPARVKVEALRVLERHRVEVAPLLERVVDLALAPAKTVRSAAEAYLRAVDAPLREILGERTVSGSPGERQHALRLLLGLYGEEARPLLAEKETSDPAASVRQAARELLASPAPESEAAASVPAASSVTLARESEAALAPETRELVASFGRTWAEELEAEKARAKERGWSTARYGVGIDRRTIGRLLTDLESLDCRKWTPEPYFLANRGWGDALYRLLDPLLARPDFTLVHFVRLLVVMGELGRPRPWFHVGVHADALARRFRRHRPFGLDELGSAMQAVGLDDRDLGRQILGANWTRAFDWEPEAVWPYFANRLDLLAEALELRAPRAPLEGSPADRRRPALVALAHFPEVPPTFVPRLWELALGTAKIDRALAQAALAPLPGKEERLVESLGSGRQEVRSAAAEWLGRLDSEEARAAVPALRRALEREKRELAQGAILGALERLGVPLDELLDRERLHRDARKGLARGVPDALAFLPFDLLPPLRWASSGERVPEEIVHWLLVSAFRLKSPEPGPVLRRWAGTFAPPDRSAFGLHVLDAWIAHDTQLPSVADVEDEVRQAARQWARHSSGASEEELYRTLLAERLNRCEGSAIQQKGLLAVVAACCGDGDGALEVVAACHHYLERWYGLRAAQCKALLRLLAWIDHPSATQLLLAVATRFRTRGIKAEAEKIVGELAERRGWTRDELADRSVPTAGFDPPGPDEPAGPPRLLLDLGARRLVARLDDRLEVELATEDGRLLKSVPGPRRDEDPAAVKAARKELGRAKKQLERVVDLESARLYEAMCTQRAWTVEDWRRYLAGHPILGRLATRLVWSVWRGDRVERTFRPLPDGSLTDESDAEVTLDGEAGHELRLAHASLLSEATTRLWLRHLDEYRVEPPFPQFGRGSVELDADDDAQADATELGAFRGHLVEAFKLRSQAKKLGYTRGETLDGGYFATYTKSFPGLELEAVLEFTGNGLPEENRTVALLGLHFVAARDGARPPFEEPQRLRLGDLPKVLLAECHADVASIAERGAGFDPDWRRKSGW